MDLEDGDLDRVGDCQLNDPGQAGEPTNLPLLWRAVEQAC
jgi:hypothetical protein